VPVYEYGFACVHDAAVQQDCIEENWLERCYSLRTVVPRLIGGIYDRRVPPDASETRKRLLDAAAREFAEHGVWNASLIEVTRRAGQRNQAALRYHFGPREAVLCAVLDRHVAFLARREGELLARALQTPDHDLGAVVEAIVRPAAELAASGWRGRACLLIVAELAGENPARFSPELQAVLDRTGGYDVYALLEARMPDMPPDVKVERLGLITSFILRAIADRARALERRARTARPQLDDETFVENLVAMVAGAVSAWAPS
jgi:AcrR family transcriptional regulator